MEKAFLDADATIRGRKKKRMRRRKSDEPTTTKEKNQSAAVREKTFERKQP